MISITAHVTCIWIVRDTYMSVYVCVMVWACVLDYTFNLYPRVSSYSEIYWCPWDFFIGVYEKIDTSSWPISDHSINFVTAVIYSIQNTVDPMGNVWRYLHDDVDGKDLIKQMWTRFKSSIHIQLAFCFCYMVKVGLYAKEDDFILSTTLCQDERLPT